VRNLAGVPSGAIAMSNLWGKSSGPGGSGLVAGYDNSFGVETYGYSNGYPDGVTIGSMSPSSVNGVPVKSIYTYSHSHLYMYLVNYGSRLPGTTFRFKNASGGVLADYALAGNVYDYQGDTYYY